MKKSELLQILEKMNITPSKRFGQNFMIDGNLLDFIIRQADISPGELVIEIGPGCGVLSRKILEKGASLTAIEIDKRIAEYLTENITDEKFRLYRGDACRVNFNDIFAEGTEDADNYSSGNWKCIANLPYSISSPFTAKLINSGNPPAKMLFLLQHETGERFAAQPGTKNYGSLSVMIQIVFDVKYIRTIPPEVFFPPPKIKSALVAFTRKESFPSPSEIDSLSKVTRSAFSQRRKKMIKPLSGIYDREKIINAFSELNIDENTRAEALSPEEFMELTRILNN